MNILSGTRLGTNTLTESEPLYAFVNIDELTYQDWGEPLFTPRDKISAILDQVVRGRPRVVIVDIDLSRSYSRGDSQDSILYSCLERLREEIIASHTHVILIKSTRYLLNSGDSLPTLRPSFLDPIVEGAENIHWAAPCYEMEKDRAIRQWKIFLPYRDVCGDYSVLPSIQLLVYALVNPQGTPGTTLLGKLKNELSKVMRHENDDTKESCSAAPLIVGNLHIYKEKELQHRIIYSLRYDAPSPLIQRAGNHIPLLLTLPARTVLSQGDMINREQLLKDRIVVIGGSFSDSCDIYNTPVGTMPGAMIILNSVRSLLVYGIEHDIPWYAKLLIEVLLIAIMSVFFVLLNSFWGMLFSGLFVIIIIVPLSIVLFRFGIWIDFAMPLIGVQMYHMADEFEHKHGHSSQSKEANL